MPLTCSDALIEPIAAWEVAQGLTTYQLGDVRLKVLASDLDGRNFSQRDRVKIDAATYRVLSLTREAGETMIRVVARRI